MRLQIRILKTVRNVAFQHRPMQKLNKFTNVFCIFLVLQTFFISKKTFGK